MGRFGTYIYSDGRWADTSTADEYLSVEIHDSDIATVDYHPQHHSRGRLYLGHEPRHYFEDPAASEAVDVAAETLGLVAWAAATLGVDVAAVDVELLLADPAGAEPADVFVEDAVAHLLGLLGLPLPDDLVPTA